MIKSLSLVVCLGSAGAIVALQRKDRAARAVLDGFAQDAAWLDRAETEPSDEGAVDLGLGEDRWMRTNDASYRTSGRAGVLLTGSVEDARSAFDGLQRGPEYARIVELLVERGASPTRRLPDGRMPLFAAAESGDVRAVTFLLDHGANPNDRVIDDTALDAAERASMLPAARVIHARGGRRGAHPISDYR
jgi:hypothetical protein